MQLQGRVLGNAGEYVGKPRLGIDVVHLDGDDHAVHFRYLLNPVRVRIGLTVSFGQPDRLRCRAVLRAGLHSAGWVSADDTGARHGG